MVAPGSGSFVMSTTVCMMETETKRVLDACGASIIQYPFYLCFARDLWNLTQSATPADVIAVAAARFVSMWHERGLNLDTLNAIRYRCLQFLTRNKAACELVFTRDD